MKFFWSAISFAICLQTVVNTFPTKSSLFGLVAKEAPHEPSLLGNDLASKSIAFSKRYPVFISPTVLTKKRATLRNPITSEQNTPHEDINHEETVEPHASDNLAHELEKALHTEVPKTEEEALKLKDVAGRLRAKALSERTTSDDSELELEQLKDKELVEKAQNLLRKERCLETQISKLKDLASQISTTTIETAQGDDAEKAKKEEDLIRNYKEALAEAKIETESEEVATAIEDTPPKLNDPVKERVLALEDKIQAEEAKVDASKQHDECEVENEIKEFENAASDTDSVSANPVEHKAQLDAEKATATSEGEVAEVEANTAKKDLEKAETLINEAIHETEDAELKKKEADMELHAPIPKEIVEGKNHLHAEHQFHGAQAVSAAQEADSATHELEDAEEKLEEAETLAVTAHSEATEAREKGQHAEVEPCEPAKSQAHDAVIAADKLDDKAEEIKEKVHESQSKVSDDIISATSEEAVARHEAVQELKEEDCETEQKSTRKSTDDGCPPPRNVNATPNPCFKDENLGQREAQHRAAERSDHEENTQIASTTENKTQQRYIRNNSILDHNALGVLAPGSV